MATHDYVIANGTGAAVRSDINGALAAIVSQNSSASEPSPTYAYMRWADTSAGVMKMRNGANSAWISLYQLDGEWTSIAFENGTAAAPSIYFKDSGTDTGIYSPGTDQVAISTGGTGRLFVSASGQVGIGTSPSFPLDVNGTIYTRGRGSTFGVLFDDYRIYNSTSPGALIFDNGSPRLTITSAGLVGIGTTGPGVKVDILSENNTSLASVLRINSNNLAVNTSLAYDGLVGSGQLTVQAGASAALIFGSNAGERARIDSSGRLLVGTTNTNPVSNNVAGVATLSTGQTLMSADGATPLFINRITNDGNLIDFYQGAITEGTISVSGTTVSYNGAHLSRWSQLPGGTERIEILRGTVLSNIDEMCGWGEEDNEQLNRMKVSDVEGDKDVSGVFQCWDDDDDTYTDDFYCAMTGDFIIRIAEGVTVERGDLLMSAGDGTAKPQDDDIIRSKTVAKVTSTHVTCTYEDGSYCVPCVLMAC